MAKMRKRALISVSDKTGIVDFASSLVEFGIEIISTGGTKSLLEEAGVQVTSISEVTGFPEILDGRVKTLHPNIHGGLLAVRGDQAHQEQLKEHQIEPIDFVIVNLYPFADTIAKPGVSFTEAIENIDIGGPTMLRSAAKNHQDVTVIVDRQDYAMVLEQLQERGEVDASTKRGLAAKVFRHTANYDSMIAGYLSEQVEEERPEKLSITFEKVQDLRYGENPHQKASFYRAPHPGNGTITGAKQLHGKELSYNNLNDADAALSIVKEFQQPAIVAVKHTNPCGVGIGDTIEEAYDKAYEADPVSIFGGIVAANQIIDKETAIKMKEIFLEIIMAPDFTAEALEILKQKKNLRLLQLGEWEDESKSIYRYQSVSGGMLVPRTIESSIMTTLFPSTILRTALNFMRTPCARNS